MAAIVTVVTAGGRQMQTSVEALLTADLREQARVDANAWIKCFRLVPYDGVSMRERFTYRQDSLWWFTELYLHKTKRLDTAVRTVLALDAAAEVHAPARLILRTPDRAARAAGQAWGRARGIPVALAGRAAGPRAIGRDSLFIGVSATLSRLRQPAPPVERRPAVVAFVHSAFWRPAAGGDGPGQESYIGAVLGAVTAGRRDGDLYCVGVGPRRNFRIRRWWDPVAAPGPGSPLVTAIERLAPASALAGSRALWRARRRLTRDLTRGDAIRAASVYRGCDLWDVVRPELEGVAMLQWPWSARTMDEAAAALEALAPGAVVTYAEAGGWGRAIMLEARRMGLPSVGLQHGFIYRHWLNYLHEPDEMAPLGPDRGCPIPDVTLVFDRYAEAHLLGAGHFPADRVKVTGNARLDALAAECAALAPSRRQIRRDLGAGPDQPLALLAAKFSEIRDVLPDLVAAVRARPDMRLIIKTHPAESPADYAPAAAGAPNVTIAPALADLAHLMTAADAIVTMNSTVAIDALAMDIPVLVVGLPNNLSPFVDAGAMLGAAEPAGIPSGLEALLYDRGRRQALVAAAGAFARQYALRPDGLAARRAAEEILVRAAHPSGRRH